MIRDNYEKLCAGVEVRENLIRLREELKEENGRREFAYLLGGDFSKLCELLSHEDPKVRKNAALVLGKMESEDLLPILFDAYRKEKTLFIRADYLKAMSGLDYRPLLSGLEQQLAALRDVPEWQPEEWKHVSEEIRMLQTMVLRCSGVRHHRFSGEKEPEDVILLTNRRQREATAEQIQKGKITMLAGGVRVDGASLKDIRQIRTYTELLFPLKTRTLPADQPVQCGELLAGPVLTLLDRIYNGAGAFLFRIELRGQNAGNSPRDERSSRGEHLPRGEKGAAGSDLFCVGQYQEKKGIYLRKLSDALEKASNTRLINSVTDYEVEVRLVLRKDGTFAAMLKPSSSFDGRFDYRKEVVASSVSPVNAALTVYLARPWLKEGAQILDPFCGVGTMLIERSRAVKTGTMYGLDLFGEAIEKARRNTQRAGCTVNYVHRDYFTFTHDYLFDEVITDMPQAAPEGTRQALRELYHRFFETIGALLKEEAVLVIYSSEPNYVLESVRSLPEYCIEKRFLLNEKKNTTVFVIRREPK
ncbi:MAG: HEAT repeat domain-containing protein [Clostridiales bacterium]|nr:HEAT repeat domain-containing protein [Clostridiales bacterium]